MFDPWTVALALVALRILTSESAVVEPPSDDIIMGRRKPGEEIPGFALERPVIQGGLIYDPELDWDYEANERRVETTATYVPPLAEGARMTFEGRQYFWWEDRWYKDEADWALNEPW